MEFLPVEAEMGFLPEELEGIFRIAKPAVEVIKLLLQPFKEPDDDEEPDDEKAGDNRDRKDCRKKAISMLIKETQAKKSPHLEKFVENTLLTPECELELATIFYFLKDIEQMTWRQFCLLEGFRRKALSDSNKIEITDSVDLDIDTFSIETEIQKLIDLNYLHCYSTKNSRRDYLLTDFEHVYISDLGREISTLLDLESVELREIGKAFGEGRIKTEVRY